MKILNFKFRIYLYVIILYAYFIFGPIAVNAQQVSLSISPPIISSYMKPGKSMLIAYTIENLGDPAILNTKVLPFEPLGNTGNIRIKDEFEGPVRFSLDNSFFQLGAPFFMKTRDSQQLLLRIRVPEGAPEGDYYYTLLAETEPPPTFEGVSSSRAKATIGSNIIITVTNTGLISVNTKVTIFDILGRFSVKLFGKQYKIIDSNDPVPVILTVDNKGKNVVVADGEINLRGNFGERAKFNLIPQNILSQSQRLLIANSPKAPNCENLSNTPVYCRQPISLFISGFFIGLYKLSTTLTFGENSPTIFASTTFIAIPIKIIFGIFIAICITIIIINRFREKEDQINQ